MNDICARDETSLAIERDIASPTREVAIKLEHAMREGIASGEFQEVECPLTHTFSEHTYARSILIRKGTRLIGKTHTTRHLFIMSSGDIAVSTDDGFKRLRGFNVLDSQPGTKRCGYAFEDTIITTVHVTDETDPEKIVEMCTQPDIELDDMASLPEVML